MRNRDAFSSCHPVINFLYFALRKYRTEKSARYRQV